MDNQPLAEHGEGAKGSEAGLREPFSSGSHLLGALAGVFGAIYLVWRCDGSFGAVSSNLIYGVGLVTLFLVSGLLHGLRCSNATLHRLEKLDYAAIYLFIAATYTPVYLYALKGRFALALLIGEWVLAVIGICLSLYCGPSGRNRQVVIFLAMGWAFLLVLPSLWQTLLPAPFNLLILGGILYSVGAVVFALDWPHLTRINISAHDCWHMFVLLGCAAHYAFLVQIM